MTSLPTSYTPLESLLLFQALRVEGVTSPTFSRISDQLKSVPLIRSDPAYDAERLSPDALRQLYLDLLKDEVKHDLQRQLDNDQPIINGGSSPTSRKRKAASPTLPSIHDAAQHSHLIPQLLTRLYARYREITINELREYERQHVSLSRQAGELAIGKGNGTSLKQAATPDAQPSTSTQSQLGADIARHDHARPTDSHSNGVAIPHDTDSSAKPHRYSQAKIDAVINHSTEPQQSPSTNQHQASPNTTLPPLSDVAPHSPRYGYPPNAPSSVPMPHLVQGGPTNYAQSSLQSQQPPYVSHPGQSTIASPQMQNSLSRPSSSPRSILPPPSGMHLPQSPVHHTGSPNIRGPSVAPQTQFQQAPRVSIGPNENSQHGYHQSTPAGYYQHQQSYHDRRTSYPAQQGPASGSYPSQAHPPHAGGYQLQPFYLDAKQQGTLPPKQQQSHTPRPIQSPAYSRGSHAYSPYPLAPATGPRPPPPPSRRLISDIVAALATPPRNMPRRPLWKSERRPLPIAIPNIPGRPEVEPLSPTISRKSPVQPVRSHKTNKTEKDDAHQPGPMPEVDPVSTSEPLSASTAAPELRKGRRRQARNKSPHSVVSSTADRSTRARTRSESVSTVTGAIAQQDNRPFTGNHVKNEPSTPMETAEDHETIAETSATPSGRMTRGRRGTLQSQPTQTTNRKRRPSPAAGDDEAEVFATPPPRPTTITGYRGFDKMSATLVENISGHKHAAYFQGAVRDKNAQGYSEIIKQPQHLKSIKSALSAGKRAVAAAASAESGNVMELERSLDVIPPKAIVNGTQLEKEVMRTMANAAMFNPGEDGLVSDTREMFEDVEAMFADWRGAEQETAGSWTGVGAGGGDEEEGRGKRRKL